jgi:hypothetical protein
MIKLQNDILIHVENIELLISTIFHNIIDNYNNNTNNCYINYIKY